MTAIKFLAGALGLTLVVCLVAGMAGWIPVVAGSMLLAVLLATPLVIASAERLLDRRDVRRAREK